MAGAAADRCGTVDLLAALDAARQITDRAAGLVATIVGEVDDRGLAAELGAGSTRALLRHRYRMDPHVAKAIDTHAYAVRNVFPVIAVGQRDGHVSAEQSRVIVTGLDRLPHTSTAEDREWAQRRLVAQCSALEPKELAGEAAKIVEDLTLVSEDGDEPDDPADPDPYDGRAFHTQQKDGGVEVHAFFPGLDGAGLLALLGVRAGYDDATYGDPAYGGKDLRPKDVRQYDAIRRALLHATGCKHDPEPAVAQVILTLSLSDLVAGLARGRLVDLDQPLSAADTRQAACDAGLIPAVLGGHGEILDLGQSRRSFCTAQRRALALRDKGCSFPGCDKPLIGCHAHHVVQWWEGGPTDLANGTLLCGRHHRQLHRQGWTARLDAHGNPEYLPPAWIDPARQPRQHHRFSMRR